MNKSVPVLVFCICGLLPLKPLRAQQPLNLDFEIKSIEGINRPWGWSVESMGNSSRIMLDSQNRHHGNMGLRITTDKAGEEMVLISYSIEPYSFAGKEILIQGWIKGSNPRSGISVLFGYTGPGQDDGEKLDTIRQTFTNGWQKISHRIYVPQQATTVAIKLGYEGAGDVWFDDFSVSVNGKKAVTATVAAAFSQKEETWLTQHTKPFTTVDAALPDAAPAEDLAFFKEKCEGATIIAVGESTHGTDEFFRLKHRLLAYAVKEMNVRVFAIEDNQVIVENVNRYVMGGGGTARQSMNGMFSVWQNEEVRNMIQWIRDYNDLHPLKKVSFEGFDMQHVKSPADSLFSFLKKRDTVLYTQITKLLKNLLQDPNTHYSASDSSKRSWLTDAENAYNALVSSQSEWLTKKDEVLKIQRVIQYANLVKQYAHNLVIGHLPLYRDTAMAENISWILLQHEPGTKMLVWAHNYHISRGDHPKPGFNIYNGISMGSHLSKKYGNRYRAFGLSTYTGSYWAQVSYSDYRQMAVPVFPSPKGTIDETLHRIAVRIKHEKLFLDLSTAKQQTGLTKPLPDRFANHVNIEYGYWTRYSMPYQFDGIFFIDTTSAAKSYVR